MTHPVFFSFAGDTKELAERLKGRFTDDLVYMYTRTGVDGIDFPDEILSTIANCSIFVLFLSKAYVENDPRRPWCRRELIAALKRVEDGSLKNWVILLCDGTDISSPITDPDSGEIIDALKLLREKNRAFPNPIDLNAVERFIAHELAQLSDDTLPILPRPELQHELRMAFKLGTHSTKAPLIFVSGFGGSGRKTLIRSVMSQDFRHLTEYTIGIDSADGPEDLLRLIWGEVLKKTVSEQRKMMAEVANQPLTLARYYKQLPEQLLSRKAFIVLSKDEFSDIGETVPQWVIEYLGALQPCVQPLVFYTIPRPLPDFAQSKLEIHSEVSVPSVEDHESEQLVRMTISALDSKRISRWEKHIPFICESGANSPKLLVDIIRLGARRASLDFLQQNVRSDIARFDQHIVQVLEWAWPQVRERKVELLLLDVFGTLGVAHLETLEEIFSNYGSAFGQALYELIQIGLVEHLSESTYRVPPAIRRKLNFYLVNSETKNKTYELLRGFSKRVEIGSDQFGGVALTNTLQIRLETETEVTGDDAAFITAAMLFKAGWQKYRKRQHTAALVLFRRAFGRIDQIKDAATKIEIARYLGLAGAREGSDLDIDHACTYLRKISNFPVLLRKKAEAIAFFIQGYHARIEQQFSDAISYFEDALEAIPGGSSNDNQRSQILNELVQCLLKLTHPPYRRAVDLGKQLCGIRETPNHLDAYLRALLAQTYYDTSLSEDEKTKNLKEIARREAELKLRCEGSNISYYVFRLVDRLEKEAIRSANGSPFGALDLQEPIKICGDAYHELQDEVVLCRKWDLMFRTETGRNWPKLHAEASAALEKGNLTRVGRGMAFRIKVLTYDFSVPENRSAAKSEFERNRHKLLPKPVANEIARKLSNYDFLTQRMSVYAGPKFEEF